MASSIDVGMRSMWETGNYVLIVDKMICHKLTFNKNVAICDSLLFSIVCTCNLSLFFRQHSEKPNRNHMRNGKCDMCTDAISTMVLFIVYWGDIKIPFL